jgi:hypothetical protein
MAQHGPVLRIDLGGVVKYTKVFVILLIVLAAVLSSLRFNPGKIQDQYRLHIAAAFHPDGPHEGAGV